MAVVLRIKRKSMVVQVVLPALPQGVSHPVQTVSSVRLQQLAAVKAAKRLRVAQVVSTAMRPTTVLQVEA